MSEGPPRLWLSICFLAIVIGLCGVGGVADCEGIGRFVGQ